MDAALRTRVEPLFGHAFEKVRIHTGQETASVAESYGARALAIGSDIVVDPRHVNLHSETGQHILAHELAHVVQYERASDPVTSGRSQRGDRSESEAHAAATNILNGEPTTITANPTGAVAAWDLLDSIVGGGQALGQSFLGTGQFLGNRVFDAAPAPLSGAFDFGAGLTTPTADANQPALNGTFDVMRSLMGVLPGMGGVSSLMDPSQAGGSGAVFGSSLAQFKNAAPAKTGGSGEAIHDTPERDSEMMKRIFDNLKPLADEQNRKRRDGPAPENKGAADLSPESHTMMRYVYDALKPLADAENRRRRNAQK